MRKIWSTLLVIFLLIQIIPVEIAKGATIPSFSKNISLSNVRWDYDDTPYTIYTYTAPDGYVISGGTFDVNSFWVDGDHYNAGLDFLTDDGYGTGFGVSAWSNGESGTVSFGGAKGKVFTIYGDGYDASVSDIDGEIELSVDVADNYAVQDDSGTVLQAARDAKTYSQNAYNAANSAKASANAAHADAQNAANRTWYNGNESAYWAYYGYARANSANSNSASAKNMLNGSSNGGKSLADTWNKANAANSNAWNARNSLANGVGNNGKSLSATYDKASAASGDADYIRSTQLPDIENKIASLQSDVTNIKTNFSAGDTTPPNIKSIKGYKNATCTTDSIFKLVIEASDNSSEVEFRARADTGYWTGWIISNPITVGEITGTGAHTIDIEVRDLAGNVAKGSMTMFKL